MTRRRLQLLGVLIAAGIRPVAADEPPRAPRTYTVYSPNRKFHARVEYPSRKIRVFSASGVPLWSMDGWFPVIFLANNGEHLAVANDGNNLVPRNHSSKDVMVRFFRFGQPTGRLLLDQLILDMKSLKPTASHCAWGLHLGFDSMGRYGVETVEKRTLYFDPATAKPVR